MNQWDHMDSDLQLAKEILTRHFVDDLEDGVGLQEVTVIEDGGMLVQRADWVIELEEAYESRYGEKKGREVTKKVVTALITTGHEIH